MTAIKPPELPVVTPPSRSVALARATKEVEAQMEALLAEREQLQAEVNLLTRQINEHDNALRRIEKELAKDHAQARQAQIDKDHGDAKRVIPESK